MANISHLRVLSFITQQKELSQSSTHMNYANVVFKFQEQDTKMYFKNLLAFDFQLSFI